MNNQRGRYWCPSPHTQSAQDIATMTRELFWNLSAHSFPLEENRPRPNPTESSSGKPVSVEEDCERGRRSIWGSNEVLNEEIIELYDDAKIDAMGYVLRPVCDAFSIDLGSCEREKSPPPLSSSLLAENVAQSSSLTCTGLLGPSLSPSISGSDPFPSIHHIMSSISSMSTDSGVETQTSSSSSDWKCGDGASFELVDEMVMSEVEEVSGGQLTPYEASYPSSLSPRAVTILPISPQAPPESIHFQVSYSTIQPSQPWVYDCNQRPELVLSLLASSLASVMHASYVNLYAYDPWHYVLEESILFRVLSREVKRWNIREKNCFANLAVKKRRAMIFDVVPTEDCPEGLGVEVENVSSLLCIPILEPDHTLHGLIELGRPNTQAWTNGELNLATILAQWHSISRYHSKPQEGNFLQEQIHNHVKNLLDEYYRQENFEATVEQTLNFVKYLTLAEQASFVAVKYGNILVHYKHTARDPNRYVKTDVRRSRIPEDSRSSVYGSSRLRQSVSEQGSLGSVSENCKSPTSLINDCDDSRVFECENGDDSGERCDNLREHEEVEDIVDYIRKEKKCVRINDMSECGAEYLKPLTENLDAEHLVIQNLLCVPIFSENSSVLGIINIYNKKSFKAPFQDENGITSQENGFPSQKGSTFQIDKGSKTNSEDNQSPKTASQDMESSKTNSQDKQSPMTDSQENQSSKTNSQENPGLNSKQSSGFTSQDETLVRIIADYFVLILSHHLMKYDLCRLTVQYDLGYRILQLTPPRDIITCARHTSYPRRGDETKTPPRNSKVPSSDSEVSMDTPWRSFERGLPPDFYSYSWHPGPAEMNALPAYVYLMMEQTYGASRLFDVDASERFVSLVHAFHHENPFHNFLQAVLCMHFTFVSIRNNSVLFSGLDQIALLLTSVCLFIAHPGVSNTDSDLAGHHAGVAEMLLAKSCLFSEPYLANTIMGKVRNLIRATGEVAKTEALTNILSALTTTGLEWCKRDHASWVQIALINSAQLNFLAKSDAVCSANLVNYFKENGEKRCASFGAMLSRFIREEDVALQIFVLSSVLPEDGGLKEAMLEKMKYFQSLMNLLPVSIMSA
ncbi:hypothetical protein M8J75_014580 [Diaphorina citri]|nr:hypothetical protein M8J75_014580 [Diaphorina citri]